MTKQELDEIRQRMEAATSGEWLHDEEMVYLPGEKVLVEYREGRAVRGNMLCMCDGGITHEQDELDARFIAHARTDIPKLLAYIDELEARCEKH